MPQILYSVEAEGMSVDDLPLGRLYAIERLHIHGSLGSMGAETVRLTASTKYILYRYMMAQWGDPNYAGNVVYGDPDRTPTSLWDFAR